MKKFLFFIFSFLVVIVIIAIIIVISIDIYFVITDDDSQPYHYYNYEIDYAICGNVFVIEDIIDELNTVVNKYEKEMDLVFVEYSFLNEEKCIAEFHFRKDINDYKRKGVTLYLDAYSARCYKIIVEEGDSKHIPFTYSGCLNLEDNLNIYDIYINNLSENEDYNKIYITITSDKVYTTKV